MKKSFSLLALSVSAAIAMYTAPANACFTVIVGKNLSTTGTVLIGHNEDNEGRVITSEYYVPAATHAKGEMLDFEPSAAKIPEVEKTLAYYWQQTMQPSGYSFSDGFYNEKGVFVTSNNCGGTLDRDEKLRGGDGQNVKGGVGYGIRRLIAARATTAREGVQIAIDLTTKYGYTHEGRTYTIADSKEVWQLALVRGGRYLARRVGDNEMTFMANAFPLTTVNLKDKENVLYSPDLVENAIKKGAYKPAKAGDYSDFNFMKAYQLPSRVNAAWTWQRVRTLIKHLTGVDNKDPYTFPMTYKPAKKVSPQDVSRYLSLSNPFIKRKSGWYHETMEDIGNVCTFESYVTVMTKDPNLTYCWRTSGIPDSQFLYPQFLMAKPALGQSFLSPEEGTRAQFRSTPEDVSYSSDKTIFKFMELQNILDWNKTAYKSFKQERANYAKAQQRDFKKAYKNAQALLKVSPEKALNYMHAFNVESFAEVYAATSKEVSRWNPYVMTINAKELSKSSTGTVEATLYGMKNLDVTKIDKSRTFLGDPYPTEDDSEVNLKRGKLQSVKFKDMNGDGHVDAVMTFDAKGASSGTVPGVLSELFLWTYVGNKAVVTFDTVKITK